MNGAAGGRAVAIKAKIAAEFRRTKFGPETIVCESCATDTVQANLGTCDISIRVLRSSEIAKMYFPSCASCDASFVGMVKEVSK